VSGFVTSSLNATIGLTDSTCIRRTPGSGLILEDNGPILASTTVGSSFSLRAILSAQARYGGGPGGGSVTTDFSRTAYYYADALTPGVFLTSDSGHDYSRPAVEAVPAPGSLALAGTGVLVLLGRGWHRRRAVAGRLAVV
jgi:hypothetical protein